VVKFTLSILQNPHHRSLVPQLSSEQREMLRQVESEILLDYAPNHVDEIVKAYGFTQYEMHSALARVDKTPYEALLEGAKKSEMSELDWQRREAIPVILEVTNLWRKIEEGETKEGNIKARL
jgi:hypothetical protein